MSLPRIDSLDAAGADARRLCPIPEKMVPPRRHTQRSMQEQQNKTFQQEQTEITESFRKRRKEKTSVSSVASCSKVFYGRRDFFIRKLR
jgi:hypothetical protein